MINSKKKKYTHYTLEKNPWPMAKGMGFWRIQRIVPWPIPIIPLVETHMGYPYPYTSLAIQHPKQMWSQVWPHSLSYMSCVIVLYVNWLDSCEVIAMPLPLVNHQYHQYCHLALLTSCLFHPSSLSVTMQISPCLTSYCGQCHPLRFIHGPTPQKCAPLMSNHASTAKERKMFMLYSVQLWDFQTLANTVELPVVVELCSSNKSFTVGTNSTAVKTQHCTIVWLKWDTVYDLYSFITASSMGMVSGVTGVVTKMGTQGIPVIHPTHILMQSCSLTL